MCTTFSEEQESSRLKAEAFHRSGLKHHVMQQNSTLCNSFENNFGFMRLFETEIGSIRYKDLHSSLARSAHQAVDHSRTFHNWRCRGIQALRFGQCGISHVSRTRLLIAPLFDIEHLRGRDNFTVKIVNFPLCPYDDAANGLFC